MSRPIRFILYFMYAWFSTRHNLQIIFLKTQLLYTKNFLQRHGFKYPVLEPDEKQELLRLGAELNHQVSDIFLVNSWTTYRRWLQIQRNGGVLKKPGRIRTISQAARELIVRLAKENVDWGLSRIAGEMKKLGEIISSVSVARILRQNGIEPPSKRGKRVPNGNWKKFIAAHMSTTVAVDFFTSKVVTFRGVLLAYSLVFIHHGTRRVWISEPTLSPHDDWCCRQLRGAFWWFEDQGIRPRYVIRDRDQKYSVKFDRIVKELCGHRKAAIKTSVKAPNMNAYCESFIGHLKAECHNHFWIFRSLDQIGLANGEYMKFHNAFRPHQSKANNVLDTEFKPPPAKGKVLCRKFLGGLLRHYYREAA